MTSSKREAFSRPKQRPGGTAPGAPLRERPTQSKAKRFGDKKFGKQKFAWTKFTNKFEGKKQFSSQKKYGSSR
jgi:hypothetical protein